MKTIIANAVFSDFQNSDNIAGRRNDVPNISQAIAKLVNYSSKLQKTFKLRCKEVISSRKESAKDVYSDARVQHDILKNNSRCK